jgi:hypothetical protein
MTLRTLRQSLEKERQNELAKIDAGLPQKHRGKVATLAAMAALRRLEPSPKVFEMLRSSMKRHKAALKKIESLHGENNHIAVLGVPEALGTAAELLREEISRTRLFLQSNGREHYEHGKSDKYYDQGIRNLLSDVHGYQEDFRSWEALASVLRKAYHLVGRDNEAVYITANKLTRIFGRIEKG